MKKEEKYYQIYRIHLLNGEVIEASEEYDLPVENRLRQIQRPVPYYRYGKLWFSHGRRLPRRKPYTSYTGV